MTEAISNVSDIIQQIDSTINKVRTRSLDVSFNELFDMYKNGELIIDPDFQRLFRWSEAKRSQFIESMILELPIPPIYVIELDDGRYELIDGLQRISSYLHFRGLNTQNSEREEFLTLVDCDVLPQLNTLTFNTIPTSIQIKLKRHFIRMEVLRKESDKRLRYHMFKRLNTGGEILSPQEIRNCTIRLLDSKFNDFIRELVKNSDFAICMSQLTDEKRSQMYMEEYALRFFAFKNNRTKYTKDVGDFLTEYMESVSDVNKNIVPFDYEAEKKAFEETFDILNRALGDGAFSGFNKKGTPQGYFSSLHFEVFSIGIQTSLGSILQLDDAGFEKFKNVLIELKNDEEFQRLTKGGGKNYSAALEQRIKFVENKVLACLQ